MVKQRSGAIGVAGRSMNLIKVGKQDYKCRKRIFFIFLNDFSSQQNLENRKFQKCSKKYVFLKKNTTDSWKTNRLTGGIWLECDLF